MVARMNTYLYILRMLCAHSVLFIYIIFEECNKIGYNIYLYAAYMFQTDFYESHINTQIFNHFINKKKALGFYYILPLIMGSPLEKVKRTLSYSYELMHSFNKEKKRPKSEK